MFTNEPCYIVTYMKSLVHEKENAIALRRKGLSYNEILKQIPVAKSTLSLWLKDLPLTKSEKDVLKDKTSNNISRGRIKAAAELRNRRLQREKEWLFQAREIFNSFADDPLFHAGIALYWAEGAKTSNYWMLINTDADIIRVMNTWLKKYLGASEEDIYFRLYLHKPYADGRCEEWWLNKLQTSKERFLKTVLKDTLHKSKQKSGHYGCLRIEVRKSKRLLFMMKVFQNLAVEYYQKQ